jgi:hypothetical protein
MKAEAVAQTGQHVFASLVRVLDVPDSRRSLYRRTESANERGAGVYLDEVLVDSQAIGERTTKVVRPSREGAHPLAQGLTRLKGEALHDQLRGPLGIGGHKGLVRIGTPAPQVKPRRVLSHPRDHRNLAILDPRAVELAANANRQTQWGIYGHEGRLINPLAQPGQELAVSEGSPGVLAVEASSAAFETAGASLGDVQALALRFGLEPGDRRVLATTATEADPDEAAKNRPVSRGDGRPVSVVRVGYHGVVHPLIVHRRRSLGEEL